MTHAQTSAKKTRDIFITHLTHRLQQIFKMNPAPQTSPLHQLNRFLTLTFFTLSGLLMVLSATSYAAEDISQEPEHQSHQTMNSNENIAEAPASYAIIINKVKNREGEKEVTFSLENQADQAPLTLDQLAEVHTKKLHLLIINEALDDYHHIHPEAKSTPGQYSFSFTPKPNAHYKIWADITPIATNQQSFLETDLITNTQAANPIEKLALRSTVYPYSFALSFDKKVITAGAPVMGKIVVRDLKQRPIKSLEPVMGAFAHIVAFSADFKTINHAHPMGAEPKTDQDRSGPTLEFHYEPTHPGFVKLFAQVKINGQDVVVPFGFFVK